MEEDVMISHFVQQLKVIHSSVVYLVNKGIDGDF